MTVRGEAVSLGGTEAAPSSMRGGVECIDEPGAGAHDGGDADRIVLGKGESLEVVDDDGLRHRLHVSQSQAGEQEGMPTETGAATGDGARRTAEGTRELPVSRAGDEAGGDGNRQRGPLEVVRDREGLEGAGATAGEATEARHHPTVTLAQEDAVPAESRR